MRQIGKRKNFSIIPFTNIIIQGIPKGSNFFKPRKKCISFGQGVGA